MFLKLAARLRELRCIRCVRSISESLELRKSFSSANEYFDLQFQYFENSVKEIRLMDVSDSAAL